MSDAVKDFLMDLLHRTEDKPLLDDALGLVESMSGSFIQTEQGVAALLDAPRTESDGAGRRWSNCIGNQSCTPAAILKPTSQEEVIATIKKARQDEQSLRAVGSGHSFSDVALTDGVLLDPRKMNQVLELERELLKSSVSQKLFSVQSGITIKDLNLELDKRGLALINMGAYDGQTLAGAISTGTHGTGAGLGPLCSSVRSLRVCAEDGTVHQIEPSAGITDPAKFAAKYRETITLTQDDDCFQSHVVAMGCMGVISAYTLEVIDTYYLIENRYVTTWEQIKEEISKSSVAEFINSARHVEVDINPYLVDGTHTCVVTKREVTQQKHSSGSRGCANWIAGLLAGSRLLESALVFLFNHHPGLISKAIDSGLKTLQDSNYVNKSYEVMDLGRVNETSAYGIELSFEADGFVASVDDLLEKLATYAAGQGLHQTGPIGVRFVAAADAYLAPQYGRVSCMTELDMLTGTRGGMDLLSLMETTKTEEPSVRVHWGLELDRVRGDYLSAKYPQHSKWLAVYRQFNAEGMFNNDFTERMTISMPKQAQQKRPKQRA